MINFLVRIKLFLNARFLLNKKIIEIYLRFYENNYIYFNNIIDYNEKKNKLLAIKSISYQGFMNKMREYNLIDKYSKIVKNNKTPLFLKTDYILPDTLCIKFKCFNNEVARSIISYITRCKCEYLIIDLRDNVGGEIDAAIQIAKCLLPECEICNLKYLDKRFTYYSTNSYTSFNKIFILINKNTMSSAELLFLTLYENMNNTYVIGNYSYGKNVGQLKMNYKKSSKLFFTISSFIWDVNGKSINDFSFTEDQNDRKILIKETESYNDYLLNIVSIMDKV